MQFSRPASQPACIPGAEEWSAPWWSPGGLRFWLQARSWSSVKEGCSFGGLGGLGGGHPRPARGGGAQRRGEKARKCWKAGAGSVSEPWALGTPWARPPGCVTRHLPPVLPALDSIHLPSPLQRTWWVEVRLWGAGKGGEEGQPGKKVFASLGECFFARLHSIGEVPVPLGDEDQKGEGG